MPPVVQIPKLRPPSLRRTTRRGVQPSVFQSPSWHPQQTDPRLGPRQTRYPPQGVYIGGRGPVCHVTMDIRGPWPPKLDPPRPVEARGHRPLPLSSPVVIPKRYSRSRQLCWRRLCPSPGLGTLWISTDLLEPEPFRASACICHHCASIFDSVRDAFHELERILLGRHDVERPVPGSVHAFVRVHGCGCAGEQATRYGVRLEVQRRVVQLLQRCPSSMSAMHMPCGSRHVAK